MLGWSVMEKLRVLIVEDEAVTAMDLAATIAEVVPAIVITKASVASTKKVLHEPFDFVFLDVDVTNVKTFDVARTASRCAFPARKFRGAWRIPAKAIEAARLAKAAV